VAAALLSGLAVTAGAAYSGTPTPTQATKLASQSPAAQAQATPTPDPTAGVEVTALALEPSRFCAYGSDAYVVYVPIDVTIVNGRRAPIILARAQRVQRVLLGKTNDDVQAGRYEFNTPVRAAHIRTDSTTFGPAPEEDTFAVLKHNQKLEFTVVYGIPVRNNPAQAVPGTAYPGNLAFSVELQTWPFTRDPAGLQQQWIRYGELIASPVIAFPTILRLPANPPTENCGIKRMDHEKASR
jgi:hypothetical protein